MYVQYMYIYLYMYILCISIWYMNMYMVVYAYVYVCIYVLCSAYANVSTDSHKSISQMYTCLCIIKRWRCTTYSLIGTRLID